jgi:hypothetical protein
MDLTPGSLSASVSPPRAPPSAPLVSAVFAPSQPPPPSQPPSPLPQFVNNSAAVHWEAAQWQNNQHWHSALASTMKGMNPALL